jgi:putative methanogenesis marker protein 12
VVFVGMDHGTTGVSFSILDDETSFFKISREDCSSGKVSAIEELSKRINLHSIDLMAITYAMGDALNGVTPINKVIGRGILSMDGAGKVTGGGTTVYDEIKNSGIPTLVIPGIHKKTPCLDERFKAAYSHHASSEKVSMCYNAFIETGFENMIVSDISSNTVTMLIENGEIKGAIDACLGAMGIIHGPLDLEMLRDIDDGLKTANECFSAAGAVKIAQVHEKVSKIKDKIIENYLAGDEKAKLAIETMIMTIVMEIYGLAGITKRVDGIVLTGSIGSMQDPIDIFSAIKKEIGCIAPVIRIGERSGSLGSAQVAKAVFEGEKNILGIPIIF